MRELDTNEVTDFVEFEPETVYFKPALFNTDEDACPDIVRGWFCTRLNDGHDVHVAGAIYDIGAAWPDGYKG